MAVIAWITLSTIGLIFSFFDAVGSYNRWRLAVVAVPENIRLVSLLRSTFFSQISHFLMFGIMLVIGVLAVFHALSTAFPWLMFSINGLLVISTVQQYQFRRKMYKTSVEDNPVWPSKD